MTVHKHMIRRAVKADATPTIEITLDALVDLGAQSCAGPHAFKNHTYGLNVRNAKVPTTFVNKEDLWPFIQDEAPKKKMKKPEVNAE